MSNEEVQSTELPSIQVKSDELRFVRHLVTASAHSSIAQRLIELKCAFDEHLSRITVVKDAEFVQSIIDNIKVMQLPVIEGVDVHTEAFRDELSQQNLNCMLDVDEQRNVTVYAENGDEMDKFNNFIDTLKSAQEPVKLQVEKSEVKSENEVPKDDSLNEEKNTAVEDAAKNSSSDEGSADFVKIERSEFEGISETNDSASQKETVQVQSVPIVEVPVGEVSAVVAKEEFEKIEDIVSEPKLENFDDFVKQIVDVVQNIQQEVQLKEQEDKAIGSKEDDQAFADFVQEQGEHSVAHSVPLAEEGDDFEKIEDSEEKVPEAEIVVEEETFEETSSEKVESVEQPVIDDVVASVVKQFQSPLMTFTEEFEKVEQEKEVESEEEAPIAANLVVQGLLTKENIPVTGAVEPVPIVEEPPSDADEETPQRSEDSDDFEKIEKGEIDLQFNNFISELQQEVDKEEPTENVQPFVEQVPEVKTFREKACEGKNASTEFDAIGKLVLVVLVASIGFGQIIKFFWN